MYRYVPFSTLGRYSYTPNPSQTAGEPPSVRIATALFQKLCYENKDALSAGIIVAGWDKDAGPSVYNIPLGGGMFRQPWAIGGKY
jgi:20S proteasome subunit beta 1